MSQNKSSKITRLARQIKRDPRDSFSKFALALEFRKQHEFKKARILFEDILHQDAEYVGVYYHLGKLYETLDRLKDARELYDEGIKIADKQKETRTKVELQEALIHVEIEIEEATN